MRGEAVGDTFEAMGLNAQLVGKLVADRAAAAASGGSGSISGTSGGGATGVVRGTNRQGFGLLRPTRVQRLLIPRAVAGECVAVRSETGSGKTLAFLLPIAHRLLADAAASGGRGDGTRAIVIAPTRELCTQIYNVAARLLQPFPFLVPGVITGGEKRKSEKARLRKGVHLLIATPGRLLDHLRTTEAFSVASLQTLVLDEADRLLDLGFETQLRDIVAALRTKARGEWNTLLLSATLPPALRRLATEVLVPGREMGLLDAGLDAEDDDEEEGAPATTAPAPAAAPAGTTASTTAEEPPAPAPAPAPASDAEPALQLQAPATLTQLYALVPLKWRLVTLLAALVHTFQRLTLARGHEGGATGKVIIFVATTHAVDFHHWLLQLLLPSLLPRRKAAGAGSTAPPALAVIKLHGNLAQAERSTALRAFAGATGGGVLIATDVASRGLDLPAVDTIIQVDAPSDTAEYVHRAGRSARCGARGESLLLLQPHEAPYVDVLRAAGLAIEAASTAPMLAGLAAASLPPPALFAHAGARGGGSAARGGGGAARGGAGAAARGRGGGGDGDGDGDGSEGDDGKAAAPARDSSGAPRLPAKVQHLADAASSVPAGNVPRRAELHAALWQTIAEELVARMPGRTPGAQPLADVAREAYTSWVRAYATHERAVRHIFHPRALHLGHAAKAFGLRETPTAVVAAAARAAPAAAAASGGGRGGGGDSSDEEGGGRRAGRHGYGALKFEAAGDAAAAAAAKRPRRAAVNEYDA